LNVVERKRDEWQRPSEVVQALNLSEGSAVVDLGSGAGYFALKLSAAVGKSGRVLAVDTRRLPLVFLWVRALLRRRHNLDVIHGEPDNPHLPAVAVSAVLVANTYHELAHPEPILNSVFRSLIPGGRLVIVDRGPHSARGESREIEAQHHELPPALVENEIRQQGFEIISRQDRFIDRPGDRPWWLIVARKP